ncbi:dTDP-4-amino-4,6-dideoxy-D-glucose transaminase [Desulfosporosinus acididurans]|uniref:dTDP-4-amino-4,6-dideoxy-D-glucose transaminase n=1 Tax=Desulfosporosinus acididurans TaxID=476652 RepID=A0A0J1II45_9FIRM|nr:DegT/DnrJ/EryC1/StrS family aminotransferase [Desulfosporosinus acididurans]KLU64361.1 dTDP-4-amino-4,6-dideoxy-D-glucose transaminase [Desulfosporosinus acididurans]
MDKKILVTRSSLPPMEEYVDKIKRIWETGWMTNNGPIYTELEESMKQYLCCDNLELYVNGHMALDIAIKALGLTGEVITTPFTFASTTHALVMNDLVPVFCDIKPDDYTIDEDKVEALITEKTSAILGVHVYGQPCNVIKLEKIAEKHHLKLIFDAAHAFGVKLDGKPIANFGDISMFSFHATKVFNTIEGGALIYSDEKLTRKLKNLRNFGIEGPESVVDIGLNAKMNEFAAAMGICNLCYLDKNIQKRKHAYELYFKRLKDFKGIKMIDNKNNQNVLWNYAYFPIVIDEKLSGFTRNELFDELQKKDIFTRKYFYPLITDFECYHGKFEQYELPVAHYVADRVLSLPIYADLEEEDILRICDAIIGFKTKKI